MPAIAANQQKKSKQKQATEALKLVQQTIRSANQEQDILQQFPAFNKYDKNGLNAIITFSHGNKLSQDHQHAIWGLFDSNMRDIYNRDVHKWNPKEKKRELFHEEARYLLAVDTASGKLLAYTHFRFELEENILTNEDMQLFQLARYQPVLYCYELQLDACVQRKGLGKRLMQMLELMALSFKMEALLLTVHQSNEAAHAFYRALGYKQHASCPERNAFEDFDDQDPGHRIMWKDLRRN
eukprot:GHRR01012395.1.p1 GENE.GHRR01012395.1~~GHRR01012395.1.p1  ORF type:complete len:239 (+),score=70.88 GHRR01012395.1:527-1243(+)